MILESLVNFSNFYGSNEELVLAGGGNTSAKDGDVMYIKGSGTRLSDITAEGFVRMSREKIAEIFTKTYPDNDKEREALSLADLMAAKLPGQEDKRPSVETTLHSLFAYTYVLHLHPTLVNGLSCALGGKEKAKELIVAYGTERVLFGTDYPMWTPEEEIARFMALPLTDEEREMILHENFERFIGERE